MVAEFSKISIVHLVLLLYIPTGHIAQLNFRDFSIKNISLKTLGMPDLWTIYHHTLVRPVLHITSYCEGSSGNFFVEACTADTHHGNSFGIIDVLMFKS